MDIPGTFPISYFYFFGPNSIQPRGTSCNKISLSTFFGRFAASGVNSWVAGVSGIMTFAAASEKLTTTYGYQVNWIN